MAAPDSSGAQKGVMHHRFLFFFADLEHWRCEKHMSVALRSCGVRRGNQAGGENSRRGAKGRRPPGRKGAGRVKRPPPHHHPDPSASPRAAKAPTPSGASTDIATAARNGFLIS